MGQSQSVVRLSQLTEGPLLELATYPVMKEYKITRRREQIFSILAENHGKHLSAYDIYSELKRKDYFGGMATVYRTVELFLKVGIIRTVNMGDGCKRYELCLTRDGNLKGRRHSHLVCLNCSNVIEIDLDISSMLKPQLDEMQFRVDDITLMITGHCKECQRDTS